LSNIFRQITILHCKFNLQQMTDYISDDEIETDSLCESKEDTVVRNVNKPLRRLFCVSNAEPEKDVLSSVSSSDSSSSVDDLFDWNPPKTCGLRNSFPIIQRTYIERMERGERIDYFEILKDDLRNMRPLTKEKFEYVKNLKPCQMFEIIEIYNDVTKLLMQISNLPQDD
jgi:hypothetical protein